MTSKCRSDSSKKISVESHSAVDSVRDVVSRRGHCLGERFLLRRDDVAPAVVLVLRIDLVEDRTMGDKPELAYFRRNPGCLQTPP